MSQTKITSNIEELKKILKEIYKKWEEATEFLEAIESNADDLKDEISTLKSDNDSKDNRISELEDEVLSDPDFEGDTIQCGIGEIQYFKPDNLVLQDVMENLETAIKKTTPRKVNELLSGIKN